MQRLCLTVGEWQAALQAVAGVGASEVYLVADRQHQIWLEAHTAVHAARARLPPGVDFRREWPAWCRLTLTAAADLRDVPATEGLMLWLGEQACGLADGRHIQTHGQVRLQAGPFDVFLPAEVGPPPTAPAIWDVDSRRLVDPERLLDVAWHSVNAATVEVGAHAAGLTLRSGAKVAHPCPMEGASWGAGASLWMEFHGHCEGHDRNTTLATWPGVVVDAARLWRAAANVAAHVSSAAWEAAWVSQQGITLHVGAGRCSGRLVQHVLAIMAPHDQHEVAERGCEETK